MSSGWGQSFVCPPPPIQPIVDHMGTQCYVSFDCLATSGLCIKVGRGQGDGDIGTRVWGLGTWGRETRDLRTSSMGRGDVWDGDAGTSNTGTQGTRDVNDYCKSRR